MVSVTVWRVCGLCSGFPGLCTIGGMWGRTDTNRVCVHYQRKPEVGGLLNKRFWETRVGNFIHICIQSHVLCFV